MKHMTQCADHVHHHLLWSNVSNMSINMEQSPSLINTNTNRRKRQYSMNTHYTKQQTQHNTDDNEINSYCPPSCKRQKLSSIKPYSSSFKSSNNYYNKHINNNTCINSTNTLQQIKYNNINNNTSDRNENSHRQLIT
eukprot:982381_1